MSRRSDDDLAALLDELSGTLDQLRTELDDQDRRQARGRSPERPERDDSGRRRDDRRRGRGGPQIPRPGQFLQFTEEYTIPALIAFLEANIKALELLRGLLRVLNGGGDVSERRVESVGRRTLGQVDDLLGDVQGALEGQPSNPEARDLLADARALREDIDERISSGAVRRERERADRDDTGTDRDDRWRGRQDRSDAPVTIDVSDSREGEAAERDRSARRGEDSADGPARRDEVDVDSELDSLRRQVRGSDESEGSDDADAGAGGASEGSDEPGDGNED
ncbi:DUF7547 family protein [Halomarina oriensis]|uniref:Uncharacterized protein n=1 Tax=Halomarina oriensis TaxID=671145 RepID=A0A6B0GFN4_9EURY|nr:hypothetical protein [Halomarina oriensis]MWG33632.1 hypothetical protein [Halomarina oriensis]